MRKWALLLLCKTLLRIPLYQKQEIKRLKVEQQSALERQAQDTRAAAAAGRAESEKHVAALSSQLHEAKQQVVFLERAAR